MDFDNNIDNKAEFLKMWNNQTEPLVDHIPRELVKTDESALDMQRKYWREYLLCEMLVRQIPLCDPFPEGEFEDPMFRIRKDTIFGMNYIFTNSSQCHPGSGSVPIRIFPDGFSLTKCNGIANVADVVAIVRRIHEIFRQTYGNKPEFDFDAKCPWWKNESFYQSFVFDRTKRSEVIRKRPDDNWYIKMLQLHGYYDHVGDLLRDDLKFLENK